jgi:hypothetical protein
MAPSSHTTCGSDGCLPTTWRGYGAKVNLYRAVGAGTAIYGAGLVIVPEILTRPAGIAQRGSQTWIRVSLRAIGVRDVAVGLAMTQARSREAVVSLGAVRIAADLGDAVFFGWALPASNAIKVGGPAAGWAALSAVATARAAARTPSYVMRQPGGTPAAQATGSPGLASGTDVRQGDDRD